MAAPGTCGHCGRTPCGVRGLKYIKPLSPNHLYMSHPVWGAWIEIGDESEPNGWQIPSHPVWGAWIEMRDRDKTQYNPAQSHPVWGAWIEIELVEFALRHVESHPVWGAWIEIHILSHRNGKRDSRTPCGVRGLKYNATAALNTTKRSHPVWGAWIEMMGRTTAIGGRNVAPRVGCVD